MSQQGRLVSPGLIPGNDIPKLGSSDISPLVPQLAHTPALQRPEVQVVKMHGNEHKRCRDKQEVLYTVLTPQAYTSSVCLRV
jgi:hypothetical protein